jgi:carbon monoxide dehydrogenase subunit G
MATIRKDIPIEADAETVWEAVRDVGAVHRRLVPGVLVDTRIDGDARIVTFANGLVIRERIVDIDDEARRFAWSAVGGLVAHHNASMQVFDEGEGRSRIVWIADLLPHDISGKIGALIDQGVAAIKRTLDRREEAAELPFPPQERLRGDWRDDKRAA